MRVDPVAVAPSYETLRPMKDRTSGAFPVYPGLSNLLANATGVDETVAHALGTCAGYAYADHHTVAMIMARMGLANNRCLRVCETVDAMFICSTAYIVQSECGRVAILCYRGTEPANFINWLTDADVTPEKVSFNFPASEAGPFEVHGGFYRNVRATRYAVIAALKQALDGESISGDGKRTQFPLQALYVTGHSLGAAMAALMGAMLVTDPAYRSLAAKLKGICTFGQPMAGNPAFARACERDPILMRCFVRYVFGHDIVPELPPVAAGEFAHFGPERRLEAGSMGKARLAAQPTAQLSHLAALAGAPISMLAHSLKAFRDIPMQNSIYDHGPQHYISALTPGGIRSEFGD